MKLLDKIFSIKKEDIGTGTYIVISILGIKIKKRIQNYYDILQKEKYTRELTKEEKKYVLSKMFKERVGYEPDLDNPKSFNEKLNWLKLNYENPLMTICADKYLVRDYVKEKIGEEYLIPLLGVWDNPDEIDFDKLPNQFVLKVNWGSGQNIIVKDKSKFDINEAKNKLRNWIKPESNHYYEGFEPCYKNIQPKIICEQFIEQMDGNLLDWKFHCFNGIPRYVHIDIDRYENHTRCFYDMFYRKQPFSTFYPNYKNDVPKPAYFEKMENFAKLLSKNFINARVDFYYMDGDIKFGEITFYHGCGFEPFEPVEWDYKLGEMIDLLFING